MFKRITNLWKIERSRRLSIVFGFMIFVGLILVTLGIMATIKVTPYATYTNKKYGFVIKFPAHWKPILKPAGGAIVVFVSPKTNSTDLLQENLNVSIKDMPQAMTIDYLSKMIVSQVTGTFGEQLDVLQSMPIALGGKPGYRLTFAGYDPKITNPIQYVTVWTMVGNRVFILTFTGLKNDYPLFEKKVDKIFQSFKFLPPQSK